jgi:glycerol-3-phosphate cytidylyltransferase-like family protein
MSYSDRLEIVRSCRFVDVAVPQTDLDKVEAWRRLRFDVLFVGDDWYGDDRWSGYEAALREEGVRLIYFPYTQGISSSLLQQKLRAVNE